MNAVAGQSEVRNPKTGMTHTEMKQFIRNHFEEFVNRKNLGIGEANFAPGFLDHGADVPPGLPPGPAAAERSVGAGVSKEPPIRVHNEERISQEQTERGPDTS